MTVFISWSGEQTKQIAGAFRDLLRHTLHTRRMFFSDVNLLKGRTWFEQLRTALSDSTFCIVIATPESIRSQWVMFEAGVVWRATDGSNVSALMIGIDGASLNRTPLSQFQNTLCKKEDVFSLIQQVHSFLGSPADEDVLKEAFDRAWPSFHDVVEKTKFDAETTSVDQLSDAGSADLMSRFSDLENYLLEREKRLLAIIKSTARETRSEVAAAIVGQGPFATASVPQAREYITGFPSSSTALFDVPSFRSSDTDAVLASIASAAADSATNAARVYGTASAFAPFSSEPAEATRPASKRAKKSKDTSSSKK